MGLKIFSLGKKRLKDIFENTGSSSHSISSSRWDISNAEERYSKDWVTLLRRVGVLSDKNTAVIFDVGAHWGESALKFRELWPSAAIYSFEPFAESFAKLKKNVSHDHDVKTIPLAVSAQSGTGSLHPTNYSVANSLLEVDPAINHWADDSDFINKKTASVETVTLDVFATGNGISKIDLLKMDIQGSELDALRGAEKLLSQQAIDVIICEVEFTPLYKNQAYFWDVASFLHDHHYHFVNFIDLKESEIRVLRWADALFVKPSIWTLIQDSHYAGKFCTGSNIVQKYNRHQIKRELQAISYAHSSGNNILDTNADSIQLKPADDRDHIIMPIGELALSTHPEGHILRFEFMFDIFHSSKGPLKIQIQDDHYNTLGEQDLPVPKKDLPHLHKSVDIWVNDETTHLRIVFSTLVGRIAELPDKIVLSEQFLENRTI